MPIFNDLKLPEIKTPTKINESIPFEGNASLLKNGRLSITLLFFNCNYKETIEDYLSSKDFSIWVKEMVKKIKKYYVSINKMKIDISYTKINTGIIPKKLLRGSVLINCINSNGRSYISGNRRVGVFYRFGGSPYVIEHEFGHILGLDDRYNYVAYYNINNKSIISGANFNYIDSSILETLHNNYDSEYIENFGWLNNLYSTKAYFIEEEYKKNKVVRYGYVQSKLPIITTLQKTIIMNPQMIESANGSSETFIIKKEKTNGDFYKTPYFKASFIGRDVDNSCISDWQDPQLNSIDVNTRKYKNNSSPLSLIKNPEDIDLSFGVAPFNELDNWLYYIKILFNQDLKYALRFCIQKYIYSISNYTNYPNIKYYNTKKKLTGLRYTSQNKNKLIDQINYVNSMGSGDKDIVLNKSLLLDHLFMIVKNFKVAFEKFGLANDYHLFITKLTKYHNSNSTLQEKDTAKIELLDEFKYLDFSRIYKSEQDLTGLSGIQYEAKYITTNKSVFFLMPKFIRDGYRNKFKILKIYTNAYNLAKLNEKGAISSTRGNPKEMSTKEIIKIFNSNNFYNEEIKLT